ncbi:hypothetical protein C8R44DRAFT_749239 [Mycena epipterygia]|nr:hypothetical protein C8R44DRAFT_749239 [Mycena epipterygia]
MPTKVMILAQFDHKYCIRGTLKRQTDVVAWLKAWWICVRVKQVTDQKSMPLLPRWGGKVVILAQFGHGYYICGTLKRLTDFVAWLKALWIHFDHGYYIRGTLKRLTDVVAWLKAWWTHMSMKQFDHKYYIRGTLKRQTDVVAWLKAWWICVRVKQVTDQKSMPLLPHWGGKVVILAQFDHGYYIRGTLKRLADVVAWLKAWWIYFDHGYYIRGTLKWLIGVLALLKASCIRTRNPCPHCLAGEEMPAKVVILAQFDHGYYIRGTLNWLMGVLARLKASCIRILYLWDFDVADGCFGLAQGLVDPYEYETSHRPEIHATVALPERKCPQKYYICGTLKWLMGVLAWLKAWWIYFDHKYYIRGTLKRQTDAVAWLKAWWICVRVKQVTDQKSMPLLPRWGGKVVILAQFDHGYYIRGTLKRLADIVAWLKSWWIYTRNPCPRCLAGEQMPAKVVILAQFDHGYYIRGTLKRLTDFVAWLKALWIHTRNPCHCCLAGEEMPTKVMILAQFDHGYYIRGTLKRQTDVVAWLKAWWICVRVKQVTDQKSMPLLPRWGGKVVILAQFGHRYCLRGTLKWLTVTNSKAVFCAFPLKMSEDKS